MNFSIFFWVSEEGQTERHRRYRTAETSFCLLEVISFSPTVVS